MKKPGVVPGFDDSRPIPAGANPRRGAHTLPRYVRGGELSESQLTARRSVQKSCD